MKKTELVKMTFDEIDFLREENVKLEKELSKKHKRVADLEAKLAESDAEIERFKEINAVQKNKIINIDKMYKQSQEEQKKLKQQLTEKEYSIGMLNQHLTDKAIEIERLGEEIKELKTENMNIFECSQKLEQKLDDKEKEIEKQNRRISLLEKYKNDQKTRAHDYYKRCKQVNQDKISFAVERLEKVKEEIGNNISPIIFQDCYWLGKQTVLNKIDNQIEELKKEI